MTTSQVRWHKGNERFYQVRLQKDLLGDWSLTCIWGSRRSRLGNYKNHTFDTQNEAWLFIQELRERRRKRGYEEVAPTL